MIELRKICAGYGAERVLEGLSLRVPKGSLVSLVGPNGSGKSTLIKAVLGLIAPSSGDILLDGRPVSSLGRQELARRIAYLAQGRSVADMTVGQLALHGRFPHLRYPRRYGERDRAIARSALRQMGIEALAERPLASLSGGMRQKAYIAMALAQDADYILLDEPTTYLDVSRQLELMNTLRALADAGKGVLAVLHDLPLAFTFSDCVAVLQDGTIALCGAPGELSGREEIRRLFGVSLTYSPADQSYHYLFPPRPE